MTLATGQTRAAELTGVGCRFGGWDGLLWQHPILPSPWAHKHLGALCMHDCSVGVILQCLVSKRTP